MVDPPPIDCSFILHIPSMISGDACAAARATIRAAEIQAKATRWAAVLGLVAGGAALFAGILAYVAAYIQYSEGRRQQARRQEAYVKQLNVMVEEAMGEFGMVRLDFQKKIVVNAPDYNVNSLRLNGISFLRDELAPANWERLSMLGTTSLARAQVLYWFAFELIDFIVEFRDRPKMFPETTPNMPEYRNKCDHIIEYCKSAEQSTNSFRKSLAVDIWDAEERGRYLFPTMRRAVALIYTRVQRIITQLTKRLQLP